MLAGTYDGAIPLRMANASFEFQPRLEGPTLLVRPLVADDLETVYAAASDPEIWAIHPESDRWKRPVFERGYWAGALASGGAFTVIHKASGAVIGSSRYYQYEPEQRTIAIGYTFLTRAFWGGVTNQELKRLMLDHAFQYVDAVIFHIGSGNLRSRRALEKIGGEFLREESWEVHGVSTPHAIYRITKR